MLEFCIGFLYLYSPEILVCTFPFCVCLSSPGFCIQVMLASYNVLGSIASSSKLFYFIFNKCFILFYFLERGMQGEREGEKNQCVVASHMLPLGTWPPTQTCALTGNRTSNPLGCRPVFSPLSYTRQGSSNFLKEVEDRYQIFFEW